MPVRIRSIPTKKNGQWYVGNVISVAFPSYHWAKHCAENKTPIVQGHLMMFVISSWISEYMGSGAILREISTVRFRNYLRVSEPLSVSYQLEDVERRGGYTIGFFQFSAVAGGAGPVVIEPAQFKVFWPLEPGGGS